MTRHHDPASPTADGETGWYDEHGRPAPWPEDFFDPDSGWHPAGSEDPNGPETF